MDKLKQCPTNAKATETWKLLHGYLLGRSCERLVLLITNMVTRVFPLIMSGFGPKKAILPNSPIPKIEHLQETKFSHG
jgi:hypothetical protein